jgi:hypothetical protein
MIPITQSPVDAAMAPNSMSFVIRDSGILGRIPENQVRLEV